MHDFFGKIGSPFSFRFPSRVLRGSLGAVDNRLVYTFAVKRNWFSLMESNLWRTLNSSMQMKYFYLIFLHYGIFIIFPKFIAHVEPFFLRNYRVFGLNIQWDLLDFYQYIPIRKRTGELGTFSTEETPYSPFFRGREWVWFSNEILCMIESAIWLNKNP